MPILNEIRIKSDLSPEQIFERLLLYSNFDVNGFKKGDPDKKFNTYFETDKYLIYLRPPILGPEFVKKINSDMLAELTLTKIENNKTNITYKVEKSIYPVFNEYQLYFIIIILVLALLLTLNIYLKIFSLLPVLIGVFIIKKKRKVLDEYRKQYLKLLEKILKM